MNTNLDEIDEEELLKQAVRAVFDEVNKESFIPDWDRALLELLGQDTLPIISVIHFKFADVLEDGIELKDTKFETLSKNVLEQIKKNRTDRRKETIKSILETDRGPSLNDLWSDLGLEFWSKMCQIDVQDLKSTLPSDFFLEKKDNSPKIGEVVRKKISKKKFLEKMWGPFRSLIDFIWGSEVQIVPPRRVIPMEEKFKVISYEKLLLPQSDVKEEEKEFGLNQRVKKALLLLYKIAIKSVGGKWPKTYKPNGENILNDMLIWVLDLDKAQERIAAFKKNMIKRDRFMMLN